MAGFTIRLETIAGAPELRQAIRKVRELGEDATPLMRLAAATFEASVERRFDTERGPGGIPWPKSRRAAGLVKGKPAGKTLRDTGDLRGSIRTEVRPNEVEIGSDGLKNPVKAIANQEGSHRQSVVLAHTRTINSAFGIPFPSPKTVSIRAHGRMTNLPARPFIGFDEEDKRDLGDAWRDHLKGLFHG
ncbi:MAG: hypothetical protein DI640_14675 [Sphingomonas taxi]|uniref:Phage virion morphogenesis protein n=1 Tax=Sphingomonas taxi TaxID=1549858 RepID=A0A2W5ASR0_9SPHN|nr:MAG: hypothetical protein DI640_14675 [Sphingomonas taxi]